MYAFPGKKLQFMGSELGQWDEWSHDKSLDWHLLEYDPHRGILNLTRALTQLHREEPAFFEVDFHYSGFEWIDFRDEASSVIAFDRKSRDGKERISAVFNCTPVPRTGYRVGVMQPGEYAEIFNSDASVYGGSNLGNLGGVASDPIPCHGREHSLSLMLPPLAALFFKRK